MRLKVKNMSTWANRRLIFTLLANARCRSELYLNKRETVTAKIIDVLASGNNILSFQGLKTGDASTEQDLKPVVEGLRTKGRRVLLPKA